jgi:hypothetical protein
MRQQCRKDQTHMLVILPMHHRSPSAAGTVPTSSGGVLAELAGPVMFGTVIAHASGVHDAQLHVQGAPEAVSKVTASTAPAAAVGRVKCAAYRTGTGECAPLTVGVNVVGAAAQRQSASPQRAGSPTVPLAHRSDISFCNYVSIYGDRDARRRRRRR